MLNVSGTAKRQRFDRHPKQGICAMYWNKAERTLGKESKCSGTARTFPGS